MNKKELIKELAIQAGVTQEWASAVLEAFTNVVISELTAGRELTIRDLGKFSLSKRKERSWVNPSTWKAIQIKAMNVARFKAWARLKQAVKYI